MVFNLPKCGCAICQTNPDNIGEHREESGQSNALGSLNPLVAIVAGTAIEALTDGTPTNGTNPFIDSLVWGGRWQTPNSTKTNITYFLQMLIKNLNKYIIIFIMKQMKIILNHTI